MGKWFAPDFAIEIGVSIRQHPTGPPNPLGGSDHVRNRPWHDRAGRRAKRFLTPSQKYEIWLQLVRQEVTIAEAAAAAAGRPVDDHADPHRRQGGCVGGAGGVQAGHGGAAARLRAGAAKAENARLSEALKEMAVRLTLVEGKGRLGLSGRVPHRVDAATKTALLGLLDDALDAGWTLRRACHELELGEVRAHRWIARRARGRLADKTPGGSPMHGLLDAEAAEILALFDEWGETDRVAPQAGPPRLLPAPGVGVAVDRAAGVCSWPTSTSGRCPSPGTRHSANRSRTGSSTRPTRSGSTTRRTSPGRGWRC